MARPNQEAIETYMSITGASEAVALLKLEEYGGNLNDAVNAHFTEGDGNITHSTSIPAARDDVLVIDDPIPVESQGPRFPFLSISETSLNPFSVLDPTFKRSFFDGRSTELTSSEPFVSLPREVREIPIEFKDGNNQSGNSGTAPTIEDITGTTYAHGPEIRGNVIVDDDDEEDDVDILTAPTVQAARQKERKDGSSGVNSHERRLRPRTRQLVSVNDDGNEIEEEMVQAVIEASKREVEEGYPKHPFGPSNEFGHGLQPRQSHLEDAELAHAVSLSLKTAKQEKAMREQDEVVEVTSSDVEELGKLTTENGRQGFGSFNKGSSSQIKLEGGSSSMQDDSDDIEMLPLVRHRSRRSSSGSMKSVKDVEEMEISPPPSPKPHDIGNQSRQNGDAFHSDEWGGISSEEHDEAVMLEAALFGGIPEGTSYRFAYPPHQLTQNSSDRHLGTFPWREPRPPSPTLEAQRLLREQQDDEYLAALQADREKELKAIEEAEARHFKEKAAREAALEEERQKEEESRMKLLEEEEYERKLTAKESSLPLEPDSDDKNAVTLLVRMPDGSRRGRRFLKSDKLQSLFDFIDVGRVVKPGTYRLVRPYPRRAFSDGESELSLSELGLTSKQEALFLELI